MATKKNTTSKSAKKPRFSLQDLGVEDTKEETRLFNQNKSSNLLQKLIPLLVIVVVGLGILWLAKSLVKDDASQAQKTGIQIERQIRDIIYIPEDEEVVTLSYINTEEALQTLKSGQNNLLDQAEVGDYYVVFTDRAILYSDADNKIMHYAPIIRAM